MSYFALHSELKLLFFKHFGKEKIVSLDAPQVSNRDLSLRSRFRKDPVVLSQRDRLI
jgi:hypothetical protein